MLQYILDIRRFSSSCSSASSSSRHLADIAQQVKMVRCRHRQCRTRGRLFHRRSPRPAGYCSRTTPDFLTVPFFWLVPCGNGYAHAHVGAHQLFALHHGVGVGRRPHSRALASSAPAARMAVLLGRRRADPAECPRPGSSSRNRWLWKPRSRQPPEGLRLRYAGRIRSPRRQPRPWRPVPG